MAESAREDKDLEIRSSELRTTREVMHEWNSIIDLLDSGSLDKVVVTKSGKPKAVIFSVEEAIRIQEERNKQD